MRLVCTEQMLIMSISLIILGGCMAGYEGHRKERVNIFITKPETESSEVLFFTSLDGFKPRRAERLKNGKWMVTALADREFSYFFLIDGRHYIPSCRYKEDDGYGHQNCIYSPQQ